MRGSRARLACLPLLLLAGCAAAGAPRPDGPATLAALFPPAAAGLPSAAEGEFRLSLGGRSVSLPGVALLRGPSSFRIDLLDPLDRPAAVIFDNGGRIVQYVPRAAAASRLDPFPRACSGLSPGAWVPYALGEGPPPAERGSYRRVSFLGRHTLERYDGGALAEEILLEGREGAWVPARVTWYCGGESALVFASRAAGAGRRSMTVDYLRAGLKVRFETGGFERARLPAGVTPRPLLPEGTRWTSFDLVHEP